MIVALTLAAAASAAQPPTPLRAPQAACPPSPPIAAQGVGRPAARKMTELPPARHILAVEKRVGGCAVNVLKQKDLAGNHVMVPAGPASVRAAPVKERGRR